MSLRLQCVQSLKKIIEEKVFFNSLKTDFKTQDTAFANFLILTALRRKASLDKLLKSMLAKKIPQKNKILEYILLLGSTEILYMDTPDYAAINEYVNIAKKLAGKFSSSMVNAVLHKVTMHKDDMKNAAEFPQNFIEILKKDYTQKQIDLMAQTLLEEPPLDLSVKQNPEIWAEKLGGTLFENNTIRLNKIGANIASMEGYRDGFWWVQDLAASLPVYFIQNLKAKKVLDLCAAPGGKTAQLLSNGAVVTAVDISPERLETLKENISRLDLNKNLKTVCADGLKYLSETSDLFDIILLDAPCSATGTFRKHPEVLHIKTIDDVKAQLDIQQKLLNEASKHIAADGCVLYCTCSISKLEGEAQIDSFLSAHPDFQIKPFSLKPCENHLTKTLDKNIIDKQVLRTLPYHNKNDGGMDSFFAACLTHKN